VVLERAPSEFEVEFGAARAVVQLGHWVGTLGLVFGAFVEVVGERVAAADWAEFLGYVFASDLLCF
jgi:hypothetical protein